MEGKAMNKHTQGEWTAIEGNMTGMIVVAPDQAKIRYRVAACGGPNREANARLISAAPDLLEALHAVRSQFVQAFEAHGLTLSDAQIEADNLARAAIFKAEGEA